MEDRIHFFKVTFFIYLNYNWLQQIQLLIQIQGQSNKCSNGGVPQVHQKEHTELF